MRKIILVIALVFISNTIFAQQTLFDKFNGQETVSSVIVNKKMFSLLSKMKVEDKETQQYVNLIKKLDNLKVFVKNNYHYTQLFNSISSLNVRIISCSDCPHGSGLITSIRLSGVLEIRVRALRS